MTETELINARFTKPVKKHWPAAYVQKIVGTVFKGGQPDIFCVIGGQPIVLEAKKEGGKVTALQWENLDAAYAANALTGVLWFMRDGSVVLEHYGVFTHEKLLAELAPVIKAELRLLRKEVRE